EAAQHWYQGRQRDLAADPDGGGQYVQEQPDGVPAHRQHRGSLDHPAAEAAQCPAAWHRLPRHENPLGGKGRRRLVTVVWCPGRCVMHKYCERRVALLLTTA